MGSYVTGLAAREVRKQGARGGWLAMKEAGKARPSSRNLHQGKIIQQRFPFFVVGQIARGLEKNFCQNWNRRACLALFGRLRSDKTL
jgi:hypothetical protein